MQCVKLRSVMGSYLNIHLNLFPIYVLLLLLTLSHGRPSAKVRETGELSKSHRQQFKNKWYQLSNLFPASNIISVSNDYSNVAHGNSQPISHLHLINSDQQVNGIPTSVDTRDNMKLLVENSKATGSRSDSVESNHLNSPYTSEAAGVEATRKQEDVAVMMEKNNAVEVVSHSPAAGFLPRHPGLVINEKNERVSVPPPAATESFPVAADDEQHPERNHSSKWYVIPDASYQTTTTLVLSEGKHAYGKEGATGTSKKSSPDVGGLISDHNAPLYMRNIGSIQAAAGMDEPQQPFDFVLEDDTAAENNEVGSQQQLVTFRQNILRSLGHHDSALDSSVSPTNATLDYNDVDSLAKYNITKEEYLQAYTEYMTNVKKRRLASRGMIGVKDRRRNAVTISKTYHDNGTDLFSIGSKVLKLFRFEIQYTPTMEGTDVRIQRVVLSMPTMCQLTGQLQNSTDLPDLKELSDLSTTDDCENGNETEQGQFTRVDLTRNVTAWTVRNRKTSPFIVLAICSRDGVSADSIEESDRRTTYHRQRHQHGSSLKVVTREFLKPTNEALVKRRARRAAPTEPSTLRSFTHKRDNGRGRECANTRHGKTCCRRSLKIKFSDLGISDVILEPKEFDAHVCDGRCNARRVAYASTHAMFQHILHQTKGKKFAPRPCCVPTALTELDVLHLDPNGNRNGGPKLIVTILKDAIVKECGCS